MLDAGRHFWVLGIFLIGCGSDDAAPQAPAAAGTSGASGAAGSGGSGNAGGTGASGGSGGSLEPGWQELLSRDWEVPPGSEKYVCVRKTLDRDVTIAGFESINPNGTHHTILTVGSASEPDGLSDCNSFVQLGTMLFGSGVATNPLEFPEGVAVRLRAGMQLLLNLHLFNTSNAPISGVSGTRALVVDPNDVALEAESILAGTGNLSLPPNQQTTTHGTCTLSQESTLFAVQPHMHWLGRHMKVTARVGGVDRVIHDKAYDFGDQPIYAMDPLKMAAGDSLHVECTHENTTGSMVTWGESSTAEMCHAGVYRYPAASSGFFFCSR
jgi:hypothetical protein